MAKKSCPNPPFIPECEVFYEGGPDSEKLLNTCQKNQGHKTFFPVKDFLKDGRKHLPPELASEDVMNQLNTFCDRTVKIAVGYTSVNRPDRPYPYSEIKGSSRAWRSGTGFLHDVSHKVTDYTKPCPCPICQESEEPKKVYWKLGVETATHVIYDSLEAKKAIFECFYDTVDGEGVERLYGIDLVKANSFSDKAFVICVTHDLKLIRRLEGLVFKDVTETLNTRFTPFSSYGFIISHPHGGPKTITIGHIHQLIIRVTDADFFQGQQIFQSDTKCHLPQKCQDSGSQGGSNQDVEMSIRLDDDSFLQLFSSDVDVGHAINHEMEYFLPNKMSFTLPPCGECLYKCPRSDITKFTYMTFSPGTRFHLTDGREAFFPKEMEFYFEGNFANKPEYYYEFLSYDIDTCHGSSGAKIFGVQNSNLIELNTHAGALPGGGRNRSSLDQNNIYGYSSYKPRWWQTFFQHVI